MHCDYEKWMGMAFAMSNQRTNSVSAFTRDPCGALSFSEKEKTGGEGTGEPVVDPLASQGSLASACGGRLLLAVNAGDNTVSVFRVEQGCMTLRSVVPSGGVMPISIAVYGNLVYVLNAGDESAAATLAGFRLEKDGSLAPIGSCSVALPGEGVLASAVQPACVVFSPDGDFLVVSLRGVNILVTFRVSPNGMLTNPVYTPSNGEAPFGMAFARRDVLLVSEAGANALSSYRIKHDGALQVISGSVKSNQLATCWVSVTPDGRFAYTSNTGTGTISLYRVACDGGLTLVESVPSTPSADGAPIDSAVAPDDRYFYVLNGAQGSISAFVVGCNGHLTLFQIYEHTCLPEIGAQGLVVT